MATDEMLCEHGCGELVPGRGAHDQGCPAGRRRIEKITVILDNDHTMALGFRGRGGNSTTIITVELDDLRAVRDVIDVVIKNGGPL